MGLAHQFGAVTSPVGEGLDISFLYRVAGYNNLERAETSSYGNGTGILSIL